VFSPCLHLPACVSDPHVLGLVSGHAETFNVTGLAQSMADVDDVAERSGMDFFQAYTCLLTSLCFTEVPAMSVGPSSMEIPAGRGRQSIILCFNGLTASTDNFWSPPKGRGVDTPHHSFAP
jgi:hypothetical protein